MTEAILLVDANIQRNPSTFGDYADQHLQIPSQNVRYITGDDETVSTEVTTQRDPLAMAMYAITSSIDQLKSSCPDVQQAWCADDATRAPTSRKLRRWW